MRPHTRLRYGFVLLWRSLRVVATERRLVAFPVLSWVAFVAASGAVASILSGESVLPRAVDAIPGLEPSSSLMWGLGIVDPLVAFAVGAIATTYFNAATVYLTIRALRDERVRLSRGAFVPLWSLDHVTFWGLVTSSVGVLFQVVERVDPSRRGVTVLGASWSSAAFLVLPIVAFEEVPLGRLFERSRQLFGRRWGESTGAGLGIDLALALVALPAVATIGYAQFRPAAVPAESVTVAGVVVLAVVLLLRQLTVPVAKSSMYIYATTGDPPANFEDLDLSGVAWRTGAAKADSAAVTEP